MIADKEGETDARPGRGMYNDDHRRVETAYKLKACPGCDTPRPATLFLRRASGLWAGSICKSCRRNAPDGYKSIPKLVHAPEEIKERLRFLAAEERAEQERLAPSPLKTMLTNRNEQERTETNRNEQERTGTSRSEQE